MKTSKIIVVLVTVLGVSLCGINEEAVEFMRILITNSEAGKSKVDYWAIKIFKVAENHPKLAESLAEIPRWTSREKLSTFREVVKQNMTDELRADDCKKQILWISRNFYLLNECKRNNPDDHKHQLSCFITDIKRLSDLSSISGLQHLREDCSFKTVNHVF